MTLDELFAEHQLTPIERRALIVHLAALRMQVTLEQLLRLERETCADACMRVASDMESAEEGPAMVLAATECARRIRALTPVKPEEHDGHH